MEQERILSYNHRRACAHDAVRSQERIAETGSTTISGQGCSHVFGCLIALLIFTTAFASTGYCQQSGIQYVSRTGQDANNGLSWQTAKATIPAAYAALSPCSIEGKLWKHCGEIKVGAGEFHVASSIVLESPFVFVRGRGPTVTVVKYTANHGCAISWTANPLNAASGDSYAGGLFDLTIEGTGAPAGNSPWPLAFHSTSSPHLSASWGGACGLETRDIEGFQMHGVEIINFTSGACWWDHEARAWNERFRVSAELAGCAVGWLLQNDTTAAYYPSTTFGYGNFDLWINPTAPGQIGVLQSAGALTYSDVHLIENLAGNTTAFVLTNSAKWESNMINFHFEGPGAAVGFSLDRNTIFRGVGPVNSGLLNELDGTYLVSPGSD
jgi:hypothetical protein